MPKVAKSCCTLAGLFLVLFLSWSMPVLAMPDQGLNLGPAHGEELVFNVHWMGIPSGTAIMRFNRDGKSGYRLESSLKSYGGMDFFFPIRDNFVVTGENLPDRLLANLYTKNQNEGGKKRTIEYRFDRPNKRMYYRRNDDRKEIPIDGSINDYLSAVYSIRKMPLQPGDHFSTTVVLEKERLYKADLWVEEREGLSTANGYQNTLPVSLVIRNSKRYSKRGDFAFWFTDDERHMPVRIKIRAKVGSIGMDLMEYKDGRGGSGSGNIE
jgi:hypothetical protein